MRPPSDDVSVGLVSQLSEALPPADTRPATVVSAAGIPARHSTVADGGQTMVGTTVSDTVKTCVQLALFPQSSVTVYVRVIVPPQLPRTSGPSEDVSVRLSSQLSDALPPAATRAATVAAAPGMSSTH